jgi:DNA-binding transcriptional ArsR family regulator
VATWQEDATSEQVFRALSDATRRQILVALKRADLAAGEVAALFPISGPSVSRHLSVLKTSGLVSERRAANRIIYSLEPDRLALVLGGFSAACTGAVPVATVPAKKKSKASTKHKKRPARVKGTEASPPQTDDRPETEPAPRGSDNGGATATGAPVGYPRS